MSQLTSSKINIERPCSCVLCFVIRDRRLLQESILKRGRASESGPRCTVRILFSALQYFEGVSFLRWTQSQGGWSAAHFLL